MKKLFIFFLIIIGLTATAQGTTPSYPTIKLTKPELGTKNDSLIVRNHSSGGVLKILPVSQIKGTTNLDFLATPTGGTIFSSNGNDATLPLSTTINAGLQSPADKAKIDGIATGATANQTDTYLVSRGNHTGVQEITTVTGLQPALDAKVDKVTGKSLLSDAEITRLATLANYTHPANHPPSIITQDASNRFVTDAEKLTWNGKQTALGYTAENVANKNVASGYAGLGSNGKLISSQLPDITISDTFVTASQAAMLAVIAETGDVAVRTDLNKSFILKGTNPAVLSDWQELLTPTSAVTTVFGRNGAVTAQTGDYNADQITETTIRKFQTANQNTFNDATSSIQMQLNAKQASGSYESAFSKNTAFNKNFGTTAGTVAEGNDSRILNGQTAFSWGNHAGLYPTYNGAGATGTWNINIIGNASTASNSTLWNGYSIAPISYVSGFLQIPIWNGTNQRFEFSEPTTIKSWLGLGSNAYNSTAYLPLTGGTLYLNSTFSAELKFENNTNKMGIDYENNGDLRFINRTSVAVKGTYNLNTGNFNTVGTITASGGFFNSDRRLKTILKRDGDVAYFKWKDNRDTKTHIGYIAQEVKKEYPDQVQKDEKGMLSVNYIEVLVAKIQDLEKRIKQLEK